MSVILTASEFFDYHDYRWVAKNMLDGSVPSLADMLDSNTDAGRRVGRFVNMAEDQLFAAAVAQDRYSVNDVVTYGGELAKWIVANIAVGPALARRDRATSDERALALAFQQAQAYLEDLRKGERIFYAVPGVPQAGIPEAATVRPRPGIDPQLVTQRAVRYFGFSGLQPGYCGGGFA